MKKIILLLAIVLLFGCDGMNEKSSIIIKCEDGETRNLKITKSVNVITNRFSYYAYYECYKKSGIGEKYILHSIHYEKTKLK